MYWPANAFASLAECCGSPVVAVKRRTSASGATSTLTSSSSSLALVDEADILLLSLPGGAQVRALCLGPDGILGTTAGSDAADPSYVPSTVPY